jgi:protein gp37
MHGCKYCYARSIANRFAPDREFTPREYLEIRDNNIPTVLNEPYYDMGGKKTAYPFGFSPTLYRYRLNEYADKKGRSIFVCSMADLFGEWVPDEWINEVFEACRNAPQHNYLFLTKNYIKASRFKFEKNWWIGRTYTHDEPCGNKNKNLYLCYGDPWSTNITERANQFLSIEPIMGEIKELPYYAHDY